MIACSGLYGMLSGRDPAGDVVFLVCDGPGFVLSVPRFGWWHLDGGDVDSFQCTTLALLCSYSLHLVDGFWVCNVIISSRRNYCLPIQVDLLAGHF